ncbi:MAG TPA: class D sortase [Vicinamibacterales bacterium]|nr:class D sortase [Vicinamibacterales bacterium]
MTALRSWLVHLCEWLLLGIGLGCLGTFAYETVEARRFQAEQTAAFEREARRQAAPARVRPGGLVGMLDVPRLQLTTPVIEGDDDGTLKRAAGHLPDTPLPWEPGNSAIAGHRDGLFRPLKNVKIGDEIRFRTTRDEYVYRVTKTTIVEPDDLSVLAPQSSATLTLITCYPFYYVGNAPKRFIIHAERLDRTTTSD